MPRGKKKEGKGKKPESKKQAEASDEDNESGDTGSVWSTASQDGSDSTPVEAATAAAGDAAEVDETSAQEEFEDKLKDAIDGCTQKSTKGRVECLKSLRAAFSKKYLQEFVMDRKMTISDALEKCIKKGKGDERAAAAHNSALLCFQLGAGVDSEATYKDLSPILSTIVNDGTASYKARSACATALGLLAFIASSEITQLTEVMRLMENIFKDSFFKGDGNPPSLGPDICGLHSAALASWSLLATICPQSLVEDCLNRNLMHLTEILASNDVDLRITGGEAIALMYELAREEDEDFEGEDIDELCTLLKLLATDSNKHRAKKDQKKQRSSFRDILRAIEDYDVPSIQIKVGIESIFIDSWVRKRQYDSMCGILGPGMNIHLRDNCLIREIFGLGAPIPVGAPKAHQSSRFERHMYNSALFKARTKVRGKMRDKRSAVVHDS